MQKNDYTIVRIGSDVEKPLIWSSNKIIDYSFSSEQNDRNDIDLIMNIQGDEPGIDLNDIKDLRSAKKNDISFYNKDYREKRESH